MRTIEIRGIEFGSAGEAIQWTEAGCGRAIRIGGRNLVVGEAEADRLAAEGVQFAYLGTVEMPDGEARIVTIPVN